LRGEQTPAPGACRCAGPPHCVDYHFAAALLHASCGPCARRTRAPRCRGALGWGLISSNLSRNSGKCRAAVGTREGRDAYLHAGPFLFGFLPPKTCASAARVTLLVKVQLRAHQRERLCTSGGPSRVRRVASFSSTAHITITALQTDARRGGGSVCHTSRHLRVSRAKRKRRRDATALQPSGICHTASCLWRVRACLHRPGVGARHMPPRSPPAPASGRPYAAPASTVRFPSSSSCRARSGRVGGRPGEADGSCGGPVPLGRRTFWVPGGMRSLAPACRVRSLALGTVQPGSSL